MLCNGSSTWTILLKDVLLDKEFGDTVLPSVLLCSIGPLHNLVSPPANTYENECQSYSTPAHSTAKHNR